MSPQPPENSHFHRYSPQKLHRLFWRWYNTVFLSIFAMIWFCR